MKSRANFFHGVTAKNDPRFKGKMVREVINYPPNVTESINTEKINVMTFEKWIKEEISKYTEDELIPGIVQGFLEGKEIDSQELGRTLKPFIGLDHTIEFVSHLWDLLLDAQSNELGIPTVFLEQSKRNIEEKTKQVAAVRELMQNSSSSSSSTSSSSSDNEEEHGHHDDNPEFGFPTEILEEATEGNSSRQYFSNQKNERKNYTNTKKSSNSSKSNPWKGGSWSKDGYFQFGKVNNESNDENDNDTGENSVQVSNPIPNPNTNNSSSYNIIYSNNTKSKKEKRRKDYSSSSGSYSYSNYSSDSDNGSYSSYSYSSYGTSSSDNSSDAENDSRHKKQKRRDT